MLSDEQIDAIADACDVKYVATGEGDYGSNIDSIIPFARAIEAEVHKQDTELIRQMLDALDGAIAITMGKIDLRNAAIAAARERLEGKP